MNILITGTFYSDNWLITHLKPLAMSNQVALVRMVSVRPVPEMSKVVALYPPGRLTKSIGEVPARLLYFSWIAIKSRPDVIAGFHMLLNGLFAVLLARILRARSMYICGGGPREIAGGGYETESKIFSKLQRPDKTIESYLIEAVRHCDLVITMGQSAVDYFRSNGVSGRVEIVPGGFDSRRFSPKSIDREYTLILVGRLSKVKRIDVFLESLLSLQKQYPKANAVIVGDGPDMDKLNSLAEALGIQDHVNFAGWQDNVDEWLKKSGIFVLTSESEGLSQAMIQAMMSGLPAVVTDIGDLSDLVRNGENGFLIDELDPEKFAHAYVELLGDELRYQAMSKQAREDSSKLSYQCISERWDSILADPENKGTI